MNKLTLRKQQLKLLFCLPCFLVGTMLHAQGQNYGNPPAMAARISALSGNVSFEPAGQNQWSQATLNYTVTTGDRIYTDQGANAELEVGPYTVRLGSTTDLTMANLTDQLMQLGVDQGTVRVGVYDLTGGDAVEIDTPNGALNALGPGSYRVDVDPKDGSRVAVDSGSLQITGGDVNQSVAAGQAVYLTGTNSIQVSSVAFPRSDGFDAWYDSRDRRLQEGRIREREYVNPYMAGAGDLEEYGTWQTQSPYGPVWYPSDVGSDWVPYREGHWAYVGPWGWTWVDDEPWGYCPFHYGRWAHIGSRWGWVPGPVNVMPVYAPALVAFVGGDGFSLGIGIGGGGGLAGWFPLGPTDPFVPWYNYQGDYLRQVNVTNVRNVTNVTNITNIINTTNATNINTSNIHYAYRTVAATAVPIAAFRSGQAVAHSAVRVDPAQVARAQVITRPTVRPAAAAVFAGKTPRSTPSVSTPPIRNAKFVVPPHRPVAPAARGTAPAGRPAPQAAPRTMPGARPAPTPGARPEPETRTAPQAAPRTMPGARPVPTPGTRPAPQTRRAPQAAPRTMPGARPETRPTPQARPAPEARPAPRTTRPVPETRRAPEARPAPAARPAPETRRAAPAREAPPREQRRPPQKQKEEKPQPQ